MLIQFSIHHLRNLNTVNINVGQCNVFIGENGSGKTSLLEALFLLSRGKSFRHHQPKRYISHQADKATVFAKFADGQSMAIQKSQDASTTLRLGQQNVYVQSVLAKQLPVLLIDPSSMDVLEVGSGSRRQLLDWITFHVKPGFHQQWLSYQRLLKQRNALLRQSNYLSDNQKLELAAWDQGIATHAELITHYRYETFAEWSPIFQKLIEQLLPEYAPFIELKFLPGYDTDVGLAELLQQRLDQDCQLGYTRIGCHRADIQVLWVENQQTRSKVTNDSNFSDSCFNKSELNTSELNKFKINKTISEDNIAEKSDSDDNLYNKHIETNKSFDDSLNSKNITANVSGSHANQDNILENDYLNVDADYFETEPKRNVREQAANVLSRGEKKLLITALRLSQLPLISENYSKNSKFLLSHSSATSSSDVKTKSEAHVLPVVLIDDATAELDDNALNILLETLSQLECQVFITSLENSIVEKLNKYWKEVSVFHMKHGEVKVL